MAALRQKIANRPRGRRIIGGLSLLLLVWAVLPLFVYVSGVGVAVPAALALLGLWWGFCAPLKREKRKGWKRVVIVVCLSILCLFIGLGAVLSALMIGAATRPPAEEATLVVLGAQIRGDRPSLMLTGRLEAAGDYLAAHPEVHCVVSGGQGPDEDYTEAHIMKTYLVETKGIDPTRIAEEGRSTNTYENIQYSLEVIREQGWASTVVIATQEFHQYRAAQLLRRAGAPGGGAVTCASPWYLLLNYWVRECAAICRLWILGY